MTSGIYKYTNKNTGALYIGSAKNIWNRHKQHLGVLPIDVAIATEGLKNFTFEIIEELPPNRSILLQNERKWIDYYDAENNPLHYNQGVHKYTLWDPTKVHFVKPNMYKSNENGDNPRRCFKVRCPQVVGQRNSIDLPIGYFNEFTSPNIIYNLCMDELTTNFKYNN